MNNTVKNIIGAVAILATISLAYAAFMVVKIYDRSSEPANFRSFTVQADGKAVGVPDIATFSFQVITEGGMDVAQLQSENADKMNKAIEFVKAKGVDKNDISTEQYSVQPRYQSVSCNYGYGEICPPAEIVGYTIQQSALVKVRDFNLISDLLTGTVKSGANSVSALSFTIDDPTKLENEARAEAIRKAQQKANGIAKAAGFSIGRLLNINENFYMPYDRPMMAEAKSFDSSAGAAPIIEPGSQEISVTINMQYEIR